MKTLVAILLALGAMPAVALRPAVAEMQPAETGLLLPLQNHTGDGGIARFVTEALETELLRHDLPLKSSDGLRDELRRLRLRDAADIDPADLRVLAATFEVEWLISATLHFSRETPLPQIAISAWAHRVEDNDLAWAGFESLTGRSDERSLGRGRIELLEDLAAVAVRRLVADLRRDLDGHREPTARVKPDLDGFLREPLALEQLGKVAVLPFESITDARPSESGALITALTHATLHRNGARVVHPGRVKTVLNRRGVLLRGELDPLARAALRVAGDARHILTGTVETFIASASLEPNPHVAFSARLVEVDSGRIVWLNGQERRGLERPGLFGRGNVYDAGTLAETMMQSLVTGFLRSPQR